MAEKPDIFGAVGVAVEDDEPVSRTERAAVRKDLVDRIVTVFQNNAAAGKYALPVKQLTTYFDGLRGVTSQTELASNLIVLAEQIASATISKHLARIAHDPNALSAFCPRCGRHYRYHDKNTGACPTNPFEGEEE